jgi:hypothetical protein
MPLCLFAFTQATVSPDLRRIVLFWEPMRMNSENQKIGKKKVEAVKNRLQRQERWVRRNVTQHLNLKVRSLFTVGGLV